MVATLATDDVALFTRGSRADADEHVGRIDEEIRRRGIEAHRGKDVDYALDATVVGVDLCRGTSVRPELAKLVKVFSAIAYILLHQPRVSPLELAMLNGQLAWFALLNRPVFAVLNAVYTFARPNTSEPLTLPSSVLAELWLFVCLFPWICGDLSRPWQHHVVASDASPSFGFGVSVARAPQSLVEDIARAAARPSTFIRLTRDPEAPGEEPEKLRVGREVRVPLRKSAFKDVISSRARHQGHAGALEAEAVTLALRWILRSVSRHGRRTTLLVDAQAVIGAVSRGRSSAPSLRRAILRTAALTVGGDLLLHVVYVPSEENAADGPSRGKRRFYRSVATPLAGNWKPRCSKLKGSVPTRRNQRQAWRADDQFIALADHFNWVYDGVGDTVQQ